MSSNLIRSAVGFDVNSLHGIYLPHPFSAVEEKDRAQIGAQDNGRTLSVRSSQLRHLLEAVWGLQGVCVFVLMIRTGCESLPFSQDFRKDGGRPDSFPQICCVWKDF